MRALIEAIQSLYMKSHLLTFFSKLVVNASLLGVGQDFISFCDLFELLLRIWVTVLVWVELEGHLPVGLLDLIFIGLRQDAQDLVEVLACGFDGEAGRVLLRLGALLKEHNDLDF